MGILSVETVTPAMTRIHNVFFLYFGTVRGAYMVAVRKNLDFVRVSLLKQAFVIKVSFLSYIISEIVEVTGLYGCLCSLRTVIYVKTQQCVRS